MSGGSWDYLFLKISLAIDCLRNNRNPWGDKVNLSTEQQIARNKLADLLELIEPALKAIEWTDSCDSDNDIECINTAIQEIKKII
jgi:hypothetical protein